MINTPATKTSLRVLPVVFAVIFAPFIAPNTSAQPLKQKSASGNLSFAVSARISSQSADGKTAGPQQNFKAQVLLSGRKARLETGEGAQKSVLLFTPPYIYRLLPTPKAGIRWKLNPQKGATFRNFDPQQLLSDPSSIRASLLQGGAKKIGVAKIDGQPVEIYEVKKPGERFSYAKAWLGRDNALPYRLEATGQGLGVVASWKNYSRPKTISPALFSPPANFHIRILQSPPPLSGM